MWRPSVARIALKSGTCFDDESMNPLDRNPWRILSTVAALARLSGTGGAPPLPNDASDKSDYLKAMKLMGEVFKG